MKQELIEAIRQKQGIGTDGSSEVTKESSDTGSEMGKNILQLPIGSSVSSMGRKHLRSPVSARKISEPVYECKKYLDIPDPTRKSTL